MSELYTSSKGGNSLERRKTCEQCGTEFSCFTSDCWCNDLPNIMPLDEKKGCLCKNCLESIIKEKYKERGMSSMP
jgi:hypothetical protein